MKRDTPLDRLRKTAVPELLDLLNEGKIHFKLVPNLLRLTPEGQVAVAQRIRANQAKHDETFQKEEIENFPVEMLYPGTYLVQDAAGKPIPEPLRASFNSCYPGLIESAVDAIRGIAEGLHKTLLEYGKENAWVPNVRLPACEEARRNLELYLEYALKAAACKPHVLCPACGGKKCEICRKTGSMTAAAYSGWRNMRRF